MQGPLFYSWRDQQIGQYGVAFVGKDGKRYGVPPSVTSDDDRYIAQYASDALFVSREGGSSCYSHAEIFEVSAGNVIFVCRLFEDRAVAVADVSGMVHQLQMARQQFLGRIVTVPLLSPHLPPARGRVAWVEVDMQWLSGLPLVCVVLESGLSHVLTVDQALRECTVIA